MAIGLATLPLTGCGGDETADGRDDPGIHVTLQRSTLFETRRALRLAVTAAGDRDRDRRIGALQLRSPLFETVPPEDRDATLRAGNTVLSIPLPFGEPRCDAGDETDAEAAGAGTDADAEAEGSGADAGDEGSGAGDETGSGGPEAGGPAELVAHIDGEEVRLEIEEQPADLLAELHARECAAVEVFEAVDLSFGDAWEHPAPRTAETEVVLTQRHAGVTATVEELEGNAVFVLDAGDPPDPVLAVRDGQPTARIGVVIRTARCDPHGLIEYKRKYLFVAWVRVGDAEPVRVDLPAEGDGQRLLESLLPECEE